MERLEYLCNEVIFKENEYQKWMYSICEGSVDIYSGYGTPAEKKLTTLVSGQFFGEIGMIAEMPRTATAVAAEACVVLEQIGDEDFEVYLKTHPENLQPIMRNVSSRIRKMTEELSMVTQMVNEVASGRGQVDRLAGWLAGSVNKLLGRFRERNAAIEEYTLMRKKQQVLSGASPYVIRMSEGSVIFRAGDTADCMYEVYDGSVGIYSDYKTDNEKLLAKRHVNEVFGEMGILDNMPRSATAVCLTDCTVILYKPENFMYFFREKPGKILKILQQMCIQLRNLTRIYLRVWKNLEELSAPGDQTFREDEVLAKLEQIRQSQLCIGMYDPYGCADWVHERF